MDKECADNDLSKSDLQRYRNVIRLAATEVPVDSDGHGDDVDDGGVALGDFSTAR